MSGFCDLIDILGNLAWDYRKFERSTTPKADAAWLRIRDVFLQHEEEQDSEKKEQLKVEHDRIEEEHALLEYLLLNHPFRDAVNWCARRTGFPLTLIEQAAWCRFDARRILREDPTLTEDLRQLVKVLQELSYQSWRSTDWAKWAIDFGNTSCDGTVPNWFEIEESEPALSDSLAECLQALCDIGATSLRTRVKQLKLASQILVGATEDYVKKPLSKLKQMGYVGGKAGRGGGNWITEAGVSRLNAREAGSGPAKK